MSNIDTYDDLIEELDSKYNVSQTQENTCRGENVGLVLMSNFNISGDFYKFKDNSTTTETLNLTNHLSSGAGGNICNIGNYKFNKYIIKIPKVKASEIVKAKLESKIEEEAIELLNKQLDSNQKKNLLYTHGFFIPNANQDAATKGLTYFIQEKLSESLGNYLYPVANRKGNININIINIIGAKMYGIASALKFLNDKDISHLDVSLRNIMLQYLPNTSEKNFILKLIDFGRTKKNSNKYKTELGYSAEVAMCFDIEPWNNTNNNGVFSSKTLDIWCIGIIYWQIYAKEKEHLSWHASGKFAENIQKIWFDVFDYISGKFVFNSTKFYNKLKGLFNDKSNNVNWATKPMSHNSDSSKKGRLIGKLIGDNIDKPDLGGKQFYGIESIKKDDIIGVINGCLKISESDRYDNNNLLEKIKKIYNKKSDNNWECNSCKWNNEKIKHHCYICNTDSPISSPDVKSIISTNGALFYNYTN